MTAIAALCVILFLAWAFVALALALLIFPLPAATADERRVGWLIILGWPVVIGIVAFTAAASDWRRP